MAHFIIFAEKPAGQGFCKGFTNMQGLSDFVGIPYDTLLNHFTRQGLRWNYYPEQDIKIIKVDGFEKGRQRFKGNRSGHNRNI